MRRWFVLKDRQLLSYNSEEIAAETAVPRLLNLELCSHAGVAEGDPERPYCFALHMPRRRLVLAAVTEEERNEWLTVITFHPAFQGTTGRG